MKRIKYSAAALFIASLIVLGGCSSSSSSSNAASNTGSASSSSETISGTSGSETQTKSSEISSPETEGNETASVEETNGTETENSQIPNPWQDTDSLEDAENGSGIDIVVPEADVITEYPDLQIVQYRYMEGLIEADYSNNNDEVVIRKSGDSSGDELAGDYSEYSKEWDETFMGLTIHCKGDGTLVNLAEFANNDFAYVVMCNIGDEGNGISVQTLENMIRELQ